MAGTGRRGSAARITGSAAGTTRSAAGTRRSAVTTTSSPAATMTGPVAPTGSAARGGTARTRPVMTAAQRTAKRVRRGAETGIRDLRGFLGKPMASFYLVVSLTCALVAFGLVMMASASAVDSLLIHGSPYYLFNRQLVFVGLGIVAMVVALRTRLSTLRRWSSLMMALSLVLLVLVLIPGIGVEVLGARRWFNLQVMYFQPSEMAKLAFLLWGAHVLVTRKRLLDSWGGLLKPVVPGVALLCFLVVIEPDLHTTVTILIIFLALLWIIGTPMRLFILLGLAVVGAGVAAITSHGFRMARVTSYLDPWADPEGMGHQALQGFYALGTGGLFGVGLGNSRTKWGALPNSHSDYVFAIIGEELGLIGAVTVLLLFVLLAVTGFRIARRTKDLYIRLVASTMVIWLVAQALINIGYVVGLLPVTGITLPLISSGGTSLVITMAAMGVLASCARHEPAAVRHLQSRQRRFGRWLSLPVPPSPVCSDPTRRSDPQRSVPARPPVKARPAPSSPRTGSPRGVASAARGPGARNGRRPKRSPAPARRRAG